MGLRKTGNNVDIYTIGTSDTVAGVPVSSQWKITKVSGKYVIRPQSDSGLALRMADASVSNGTYVEIGTYDSSNSRCKWSLTRSQYPETVLLYDSNSGMQLHDPVRYIDVGETKSLAQFGITPMCCSNGSMDQSITWSSSNTSITKVTANGTVTGVSVGEATITGRILRNNSYHDVSYTVHISKLLIYQTKKTYYHDGEGYYAEDMMCGDMSVDDLRALDWVNWTDFVGMSPADHRANWENMCTDLFSMGSFESVILDMIDHFMDGSGSPYSDSSLTQKIYNHNSTQDYIQSVEEQIERLLNIYSGDISTLMYAVDTRDDNPLVDAFDSYDIYEPVYDSFWDKLTGPTICVDSLWGHKIEVSYYSISGDCYACTLHFTMYDHFGLDQADVEKYGILNGFRSWYVLQHYSEYDSAYKPFLTLMEFDVTISGMIS